MPPASTSIPNPACPVIAASFPRANSSTWSLISSPCEVACDPAFVKKLHHSPHPCIDRARAGRLLDDVSRYHARPSLLTLEADRSRQHRRHEAAVGLPDRQDG